MTHSQTYEDCSTLQRKRERGGGGSRSEHSKLLILAMGLESEVDNLDVAVEVVPPGGHVGTLAALPAGVPALRPLHTQHHRLNQR